MQPEYKHNHCLFTLKNKTAINYERKTIRMDFFTKNLRHSYTLQVDVYIVNTVYINKDGNIKHLFFFR